jgi:Mrp family chromosome partitioning ATPase
MAASKVSESQGVLVQSAGGGAGVPARRTESGALLECVTKGLIRLPRKYRDQRTFFRFLRRAGSDPALLETIHRLRDVVILAALRAKEQSSGLTVALTGARGGEGTSFIALMLALSIGACTHRRVAILDGRFNLQRFRVLSDVLGLCRNSVTLQKGDSELLGYYNEVQPNVYFLKNNGAEHGLEFFSDKHLDFFLADLRQHFDFTIIDMPPLLKESSNIFLAPLVDRLYLVTAADKTRLADVERCLALTREAGAEVAGIVLNQQRLPLWGRLFWREFFF